MRPAPEEIAAARGRLRDSGVVDNNIGSINDGLDIAAIRVLLAATEPPTDEEIVTRYNAFLSQKGWKDKGNAIWFADGIEAFIGRARHVSTCACGRCPVKP